MKTVKLNEEAYERLKKKLTESLYGNDELDTLYEDLRMEFSDFYSILGEHYIMLNRLGQEPDERTAELKQYADAINSILHSN